MGSGHPVPGLDLKLSGIFFGGDPMKSLLDYALAYAHLGWSVLPLQTKEKKSRIKWEKFQKEKATDDQIKRWWKKWPDANIGLATGFVSDLIVMDVDSLIGRENYTAAFCELHSTITQTTGKRGALQLLFKHPRDQKYQNMVGLFTDVDVRADGGYIVAPPSIHPNGTEYKWVIDPTEMGLDDLMDLPEDIKTTLMAGQEITGASKNPEGWVQEALMGVPDGQRGNMCAKLAGYYLRVFEGDVEQTRIILESWNERNIPPMDWKRISRTLKSIADREGREALGKTVGEKIDKIQVLRYPAPDNTRRYRVFIANTGECVEMTAYELITFSQFKIKFCELANRIPKPVKQFAWENMVNKALSEAEIIQLTLDETLTGLILKLINSEIYSEGAMTDIKWVGNRIVVNGDTIYLRMETLLNMANAEREKVTRKDVGRILRALGFKNERRKILNADLRCWFRSFDRTWKENFSS
jgi:hypothetical protein